MTLGAAREGRCFPARQMRQLGKRAKVQSRNGGLRSSEGAVSHSARPPCPGWNTGDVAKMQAESVAGYVTAIGGQRRRRSMKCKMTPYGRTMIAPTVAHSPINGRKGAEVPFHALSITESGRRAIHRPAIQDGRGTSYPFREPADQPDGNPRGRVAADTADLSMCLLHWARRRRPWPGTQRTVAKSAERPRRAGLPGIHRLRITARQASLAAGTAAMTAPRRRLTRDPRAVSAREPPARSDRLAPVARTSGQTWPTAAT